MKNSFFKLATLPLIIASGFAAASTNLVTNGSFENTPTVTHHSGQWQLFNNITGWQRSNHAQFEIQTNKLGLITAQHGSQYIELDSTANYSVMQLLDTEVGNSYEISFYYSPRVDGDSTTNKADVYWNGELLANLNATTRGWQKFTFPVKASSTSTELKFVGTGKSDSLGAFIDDVKVTAKCASGLYGINNFGSNEDGIVYHFDTQTNSYSTVAGLSNTASNIASSNGVLYLMEQLDASTNESQILSFNLADNQQALVTATNSYPIYRSVMSADGTKLRATSKTYMYDFDIATGDKTVLGKLTFPGDSFADGDIAYSADNNVLYVLTGKALYTIDEGSMELTKIGEHNVAQASGIAIAADGTIYVSGRVKGENAKIYMLDQNTAAATFVMDGPSHVNDLTFVDSNYCN
ncbi:DUF642 domain-containing protein [Pseudoalteromonas prydzensis]|uniref:DUF642 domain-containing protein n=1 Tax=Pseudoalteromonas prydzensis TaxID=182141 RepID=UPI0007E50204|nr:DUF642 domain-containing protein [Pseudoalteromonas prydzensis]MBE0378254.1 RTX toxin RtxA [Pseudoalteromonas prydzensis ACAM 620]